MHTRKEMSHVGINNEYNFDCCVNLLTDETGAQEFKVSQSITPADSQDKSKSNIWAQGHNLKMRVLAWLTPLAALAALAMFSACGSKSGGVQQPIVAQTPIYGNASCGGMAGYVPTAQGCLRQCPTNPNLGVDAAGNCSVPVTNNNINPYNNGYPYNNNGYPYNNQYYANNANTGFYNNSYNNTNSMYYYNYPVGAAGTQAYGGYYPSSYPTGSYFYTAPSYKCKSGHWSFIGYFYCVPRY